MNIYIMDASVILTSLFEQKKTIFNQYTSFMHEVKKEKAVLHAPSFLTLEVANGLRYASDGLQYALEVYEKFSLLPIRFFSFSQIHVQDIIRLAIQNKSTVYDTSYHFLAQLLGGIFITCDKEYYKKAHHMGDIRLLE